MTVPLSEILAKRQPVRQSRHEFGYQEVCSELEPIYGNAVWTLPHRAGCAEHKPREAHKIAQKRGKTTLGYLIGILKKF